MADYGGKIAKSGFNATDTPTEATKKNFINLSTADSPKILVGAFVTTGTYTHNLGYVPPFFAFNTDSTTAPTYFIPVDNDPYAPVATTTTIINLPNPSYVLILHRS